jgi:hypothetical protein
MVGDPISKNPSQNRTGGVAQVVEREALKSNPTTTKINK